MKLYMGTSGSACPELNPLAFPLPPPNTLSEWSHQPLVT